MPKIIDLVGSIKSWVKRAGNEATSLRLAIACATAVIIASIAWFYSLVEHDNLPIGWDTAHYIGGAVTVVTQGPLALLAQQGPYDVFYQLFEGTLVWAGVPRTALEIGVPIILASSIPFLTSRLTQLHLNSRTAAIVALVTPGWYAVYRFQADLHANLMALTLFLVALGALSRANRLHDKRYLFAITFLVIASFTHIESTTFLMFVTLVSSATKLRTFPWKNVALATTAIIPAGIFYIAHLLQLLAASGGTLVFTPAQPLASLLIPLGPLLPLTIIGFFSSGLRPRSWLEVFAVVWGLASILVGLAQYVDPQTVIYAQRAIILIPTPLLAGFGANKLIQLFSRISLPKVSIPYLKLVAVSAMFVALALSWTVTAVSATPNEKIFITSAEYKQLQWVSMNVRFSNTPIFLFNDVDEFAGGLAQLYDTWTSAIVGPHLAYVGLVDYLAQGEETPYSSTVSQTISNVLMNQIRNAGINSRAALVQHPIVIMGEFYRPYPLPTYTSSLFTQVSPGIFIDNSTRIATLSNITIPLYIMFGNHSGTWYGTSASWAKSLDAYEVYDGLTPLVRSSFQIGIQSSGTFQLGLRYWDANGQNLTLAIDDLTVGNIIYNNTRAPAIRYFTGIPMSQGVHSLTITVESPPSIARYASLDYLVFMPS